ncbi:MAG: helix-turn-helix transcriptional regulator [Cyanobacteriota bacterium]
MQSSIKLGEEIKRVRTLLKYDQKEFSKILNISNVYLSYIEKGKKIPSFELLEKIYSSLNKKIPQDILDMVKQSKNENKANGTISSSGIVYDLQEKGLYTSAKLKELIKTEPGNIKYIYAFLSFLKDEGKINECRSFLLTSLINIKKEEEKRWLEACYFLFEGNFPTAIELMKKAIFDFDKNNVSSSDFNEKKAGLLFELANIYYEYGYYSYNSLNDKKLAVENFNFALKYFEEQRKLHNQANYEMYYANVFWWLGHLGIDIDKNLESFIDKAENVLIMNHEYMMNKSVTGKISKGLYSSAYIVQLIGAMAESYAKLALKESKPIKQQQILKKGEFLLVQNVPINILPDRREYYNFYFSYSCFYSIKAEIYNKLNLEYNRYLDLCYRGLSEVLFSDQKQKVKQFIRDITEAEKNEFNFYTQKRQEEFSKIKERSSVNE